MLLLLALLTVHHHTKYLVADGNISHELVASPETWIAKREAFIRAHASPDAHLPVVYKLDDDFVAAARTRQSVEVVDDCGEALCGVATDELAEDWELADLRAMFAIDNAKAAALLGRWRGEDPRAIASYIRQAGVESIDDPLVQVPLRSAAAMPPLKPSGGHAAAANATIRGATVSVVNRIDKHLIANSSKEVFVRLKAEGINAISLIPFAGIRGDDVLRFDHHPAGETDLAMRLGAARAHALGMQVMLKPHVWPRGGDPTTFEPVSWEKWFASYEKYLVHEALLARAMHAEWLCIGTELSRSESRPEWLRLIRIARALYHGRITYAANFDAFEKTPFWRELDAIGVDAYFPLAATSDATDAQLLAGARDAVARMQRVAKTAGRNVILTELGYPSTPGAWIDPWTEHREREPDPAAQARSFTAMLTALRDAPRIGGYFIWKYESDPAYVDEKGFFPKPAAERALRK
jgi:hypothetical protein